MFAIFKRNWLQARPARWIGLFVFEFVVVLLGVLAAQSLQERFAERQDREGFRAVRTALNEQLEGVGVGMVQRGLQARCVEANLDALIEEVESGRPVSSQRFLTHPPKANTTLSIWDGALSARARSHLPPGEIGAYEFMASVSDSLQASAQDEESWWATLALARPGEVVAGEERKLVILQAAHNLRHAYEGWERAPAALAPMLASLGIKLQLDQVARAHPDTVPCADEVKRALPAAVRAFRKGAS